MNHEHSQKDKIVRLNGWGSPKVTWGGSPRVLLFYLNIEKLEGIEDFFPVRYVKTYCKKNYFLLH